MPSAREPPRAASPCRPPCAPPDRPRARAECAGCRRRDRERTSVGCREMRTREPSRASLADPARKPAHGGTLARLATMRLVVVLALAACSTPGAREPRSRAPDPSVDPACVAHARAGTLAELTPAEAAGFTITQGSDGIVLARAGDVMTTE